MGFQKACTIIILTDGRNGHQLAVRPDIVTRWVNQTMITYLMDAEKNQHRMHSGEIITKMCNLVAPKPPQQMAQFWMIMSKLVRDMSYLVLWGS